ncbi:hypothetical protein WDW89_04590 [Deltaproteobacteria bacterium TL4]
MFKVQTGRNIVSHSCAVLSGGSVKCWGDNSYGQLGNNSTMSSSTPVAVSGISTATSISVGSVHSCARLSDGTVQCWGNNYDGQLGITPGNDSSTPVSVSGAISTAIEVVTGGFYRPSSYSPEGSSYSCSVLSSGQVQCWGANSYGQLGNNSTTSSSTPVSVSGLSSTATNIAISAEHNRGVSTCARLSDGTIQCWGTNTDGQLGNGTTTASLTPVSVNGITTASRVIAGGTHACAVLSGGGIPRLSHKKKIVFQKDRKLS